MDWRKIKEKKTIVKSNLFLILFLIIMFAIFFLSKTNIIEINQKIASDNFKASGQGNSNFILPRVKTSNGSNDGREDGYFLGSENKNTDLKRQFINSVTIYSSNDMLDTEKNIQIDNDTKWNITDNIIGWYKTEEGNGGVTVYDVYIAPNTEEENVIIKANGVSEWLFAYIGKNEACTDTKVIYGLDNLDTSAVTSMAHMFRYCGFTAMTELDLGNFDTSSVTNMNVMFSCCGYKAMTKLNLGNNFNTEKVETMRYMFSACGYTAMEELELGSQFDTSNVTDMYYMFERCGYKAMTKLNLGNKDNPEEDKFDTSKVTNMANMFANCGYGAMEELELGSQFNTISVTNMQEMFRGCGYTAMTKLDLGSQFKTSSVTNMYGMFWTCGSQNLKKLTLGDNFDTTNVTNMAKMFRYCGTKNMVELNLGKAFKNIPTQEITIKDDNGEDVTVKPYENMFYMCGTQDARIVVADGEDGIFVDREKCKTNKAEEYVNIEYEAGKESKNVHFVKESENEVMLPIVSVTGTTADEHKESYLFGSDIIKRQYVNKMTIYSSNDMIDNNINVEDIAEDKKWTIKEDEIIGWYETEKGSDGETDIYNVYIAPLVDKRDVKIKANKKSDFLFAYIGSSNACTDEQVIYGLENLDTSEVTSMVSMFRYCGFTAMTELDLGNFDTSKVTNMNLMFSCCGYNAMTTLDLGDNFNTEEVTTMRYMFSGCGKTAMKNLTLGSNFNTKKVTDMYYMFERCGRDAMTELKLGDNFNTEKVTNMSYMFSECGRLAMEKLELGSQFNTTSVTNMQNMFYFCGFEKLKKLSLGDSFNTENVENMVDMFRYCGTNKMAKLDLGSNFNKISTEGLEIKNDEGDEQNPYCIMFYMCGAQDAKIIVPDDIYVDRDNCKTGAKDGNNNDILARIGYEDGKESKNVHFVKASENDVILPIVSVTGTKADEHKESYLFGSDIIKRQYVNKMTIYSSNDMIDNNINVEDIAEDKKWTIKEDEIIGWYETEKGSDGETDIYNVYIAPLTDKRDVKIKANKKSDFLFAYIGSSSACTDEQVIYGLENLDTSEVTSMVSMFRYCGFTSMTELDLGNFDTSKVTNMNLMFSCCGYKAMTKLDLGDNFNTEKVTNMRYMLQACGYNAMTKLELGSQFDTKEVTDMAYMFERCGYKAMTELILGPGKDSEEVSKFNTSKVTNMSYMFSECGREAMTKLELGNRFDTSSVEDMQKMFYGCGYTAMTELKLGDNFNTEKVTNMQEMFRGCGYTAMTELDLGLQFKTSNVTNMYGMFWTCGSQKLKKLTLGDNFDTTKVTNMVKMFRYCGSGQMTELNLGEAFKKIPNGEVTVNNQTMNGHENMFWESGADNCRIVIPDKLYISREECKLDVDDNEEDNKNTAIIEYENPNKPRNIHFVKFFDNNRTDLSCTIHYREKETNDQLAEDKVISDQIFEAIIEESAIDIEGYEKVEPTTANIIMTPETTEYTFYYTKRTDLSYTVNYLEKNTNRKLQTEKVVSNKTYKDTITASNEVVEITGYGYDSVDKDTLEITTGENVLNIYYEKITYTITYNLDGGSVEGNPESYTVETENFTLVNPTKEGYTFKGWSGTDLTGDKNQVVTIEKGSTGDKEYTANWDDRAVTKIIVNSDEVKKNYILGDELSTEGIVVTAQYDNGDTEDVTDGVTYSGFDSSEAGTKTITVSYGGRTDTFEVTVIKVEVTIENHQYVSINNVIYIIENKGVKIADILADVSLNLDDYNLVVKENGEKVLDTTDIKTGQKVELENSNINLNIEIVVKGDINSDGLVNFRDIVRLNNYRLNSSEVDLKDSEKIAFKAVNNSEITDAELNNLTFRNIITLNNFRLNN